MGFITTIAMVSILGLVALRPPMPRHSSPWNLQFTLGFLINEQLFLGLYWLAAGTVSTVAPIDAGRSHLLDVYAGRHPPRRAPVLIYLHGGGFRIGSKMLGARPLLYRLASHGWICVSANYRLGPRVTHDDRVIDVKRVITWVREHGAAYGADPATLVLSGSSSGAHLAATSALTVGDPRFQPGFEAADTSISAVVAMYGYYGPADRADDAASSPLGYLHADAPPFLIVHGTLDTLVLVADARHFADELPRASDQPVLYAELPGTQHNFDLFHSIRGHAITDAVESFLTCVLRIRWRGETT